MADLPHRAHRIVVSCEGDSLEDLIDSLNQVIADVREVGLTQAGGGGSKKGWTFSYLKDPAMTHNRYFEELEAWLFSQPKTRKSKASA